MSPIKQEFDNIPKEQEAKDKDENYIDINKTKIDDGIEEVLVMGKRFAQIKESPFQPGQGDKHEGYEHHGREFEKSSTLFPVTELDPFLGFFCHFDCASPEAALKAAALCSTHSKGSKQNPYASKGVSPIENLYFDTFLRTA